ncbi:MAG: hypothetical protein ACFE9S_00380 [Candidatus Hermodarchaeota archaeon]
MILILFLGIFISNYESNYRLTQNSEFNNLQTSAEHSVSRQWLENREFEDDTYWIASKEGDENDVDALISDGLGNYFIRGDSGGLSIDEPLSDIDWTATINPDLPILPDIYEINSSGCYVSHLWHENINQTRNRPSVRWERAINMPIDMRDYIITSASLEAEFNATVTVSPWNNGGIDKEGDTGLDDYSTGDYTEFYILLSDVEETFPPIRVAYNHTGNLGRDSPALGSYPDTPMNIVPEDVLKDVLTSVLENDGFNFVITLGIDIYCEDNEIGVDIDRWNELIIRSFNLTFSYEKKIDQFTSVSWEQAGDQITGENTQVRRALLNFEFKINTTWPSLASPNSEIRVLINDKQLTETIKLSRAETVLNLAFPDFLDVTSYISKDINIALKIQIFMADEFGLTEEIKISIDNVYFRIRYVRITEDLIPEPVLFRILLIVASVAGLGIGGYFFAYQRVLKYPKPVRKVRKYRRTLTRKNEPSVLITEREKAFKKAYGKELHKTSSFLRGKPTEEGKMMKAPSPPKLPSEPNKTTESSNKG